MRDLNESLSSGLINGSNQEDLDFEIHLVLINGSNQADLDFEIHLVFIEIISVDSKPYIT